MSPRTAAVLAWSLWALYVGLALLVLILSLRRGQGDDAILAPMGLGFATVGALVASRQPRNAVGWILCAAAIIFICTGLWDGWYTSAPDAAQLPFAAWVGWVSNWAYLVWLGLAVIFLPLVFPDGRLPSRQWRPVAWFAGAAILLAAAGEALEPGPLDTDGPALIENPLGFGGVVGDAAAAVRTYGIVLFVASFAAGMAGIVVRLRRATGGERQQVKWFAYVASVMVAGFLLSGLSLPFTDERAGQVVGAFGWSTGLLALVLGVPVAIGAAILRHRLYDIDLVINRTLVYAALTALLGGIYVGLVLILQVALAPLTRESGLAVAASTLAVAVLFRPARARVQALVDRRFYRRRYDAQRTVERFGLRLRNEVELDSIGHELTAAVRDTVQPAHLSLWLRSTVGEPRR